MGSDNNYSSSESTISLEGRLVQLFFNNIERLPDCWMKEGPFDSVRFNQQLLFLISLLPFEDTQDDILVAWNKRYLETKELMPGLTDNEYRFSASLVPVTKTMKFICSEFELISTDITGPASSKQYRDSAITVPDMEYPPEKK